MMCSIDADQCVGGINLFGALPILGMAALLTLAAILAYQYRELLGGLLLLFLGGATFYSAGLFQALFVTSFIPALVYFSVIPADDNWRRWRQWHLGIWLAGPIFGLAIAMAILAHEETKALATIANLIGAVALAWGWLGYMSRPTDDDGTQ